MSKMLKKNSLFGQRPLLAMSLAASVLAFGCTTDRTVSNGNLGGRSGVPTAPTSGVTSGSETEPTPTLPPPMTSSYSRPEALPTVARSVRRLTADEAAMLMAEHKPKYRVLGPVSPALSGNLYHSANLMTAQAQTSPAYSPVYVTSGAVGAIVNDVATNTSPITPSVSTPGTSAAVTTTGQAVGNGAAPVFASGAATGTAASTLGATTMVPTIATPTNTATTATPGAFAASTVTPTSASVGLTARRIAAATATATRTITTTTAPVRAVSTSQGGVTITNNQQ